MESPGFSKFRSLMDIWDEYLLEQSKEDIIKSLINDKELIMFFKKGDEYFGTGEAGRIVFAKIKNQDKDMPDGWEDDATFTACNLSKAIENNPSQHVFGKEEIKKLKVVDENEILEKLKNKVSNSDKSINNIKIEKIKDHKKDRDEAPNFTRTDEE